MKWEKKERRKRENGKGREALTVLSEEAPKELKTEALLPSSMVNNGGMNELSHELIFSSLWPIN